MSTLICIDLQHCFIGRYNKNYSKCIDNAAKKIKKAIMSGHHIIFVEFDDYLKPGYSKKSSNKFPTLDELKSLVKDYKKCHIVFKNKNDGGNEIAEVLRKKKIPRSIINVCGVYAEACVEETVETLSKKLSKSTINLLDKSISAYLGIDHRKKQSYKYLSQFKNIKII